MTDETYTIHTSSSSIVAEFATGDLNSVTRGETTSFNFWLPPPDKDLVVSSSYTVSGTEVYSSVTVQNGATLTVTGNLYTGTLDNDGTINNTGLISVQAGTSNAFVNLRNHADYAGGFAPVELRDHTQKYREQIPISADVDSIVIGIEPSDDLKEKDVQGVWGIITGGTDRRNPSLNTEQYEIEVRILAEYSEFSNHAAIESARLV